MKTRLKNFFEGFTIFHAVGILLMVAGGFIGDAPDELLNKTNKLRDAARDIEKRCLLNARQEKRTAKDSCLLVVTDVRAMRAAAVSAYDTAAKVVGARASFDGLGFKTAFTVTFTQIVGAFVFFFELLKSWLRSRNTSPNPPQNERDNSRN